MKKSKSSVPRFPERWPLGPAPPVKNDGLLATAGRPEPEPPLPPVGPLVAIAVGKTKEGLSLPAKPVRPLLAQHKAQEHCASAYQASNIPCRYRLPLALNRNGDARRLLKSLLVHDNGGGLRRHVGCCSRNSSNARRGLGEPVRGEGAQIGQRDRGQEGGMADMCAGGLLFESGTAPLRRVVRRTLAAGMT